MIRPLAGNERGTSGGGGETSNAGWKSYREVVDVSPTRSDAPVWQDRGELDGRQWWINGRAEDRVAAVGLARGTRAGSGTQRAFRWTASGKRRPREYNDTSENEFDRWSEGRGENADLDLPTSAGALPEGRVIGAEGVHAVFCGGGVGHPGAAGVTADRGGSEIEGRRRKRQR